jgi:hypothetical protein
VLLLSQVGVNVGLLLLAAYPTWLVVKTPNPSEDQDKEDVESQEGLNVQAEEGTGDSIVPASAKVATKEGKAQ